MKKRFTKRKFLYTLSRTRRYMKKHLNQRTLVLILSVLIGILGALAAIIIKNLVYITTKALSSAFPVEEINYLYLIFPPIGIILALVFVRRVVRDNIGHGVSIVLKSICKSDGKLRFHNVYSSMVSSAITVGFGGSVGLEAPMVLTGSAIGSNLARFFHLKPKHTTLLLACGSTAAMAAIFKAPIAAIVFTFEVLMLDLTGSAILPLLISAATGTVMSMFFLGRNVMFSIGSTQEFWISNIPFYIILGLLTGLLSVYFLRLSRWVEKQMRRIRKPYVRAVFGGLLLSGLIYLFPVFYGEGYENINVLINGDYTSLFANSPLWMFGSSVWVMLAGVAGIILLKVFATSLTTSAGGIGGVFAPTLFIGAFTGFFVAGFSNNLMGTHLPYVNFILAGMAGVMTGVMQAPMTAMFLIAELSGGYTLLIPLMITAACSYISVYPFEKYSVYTKPLADKGNLKTHNKNKFALRKLQWDQFMDTNIMTVPAHSSLRTYVNIIAQSKRNLFVVINEHNIFQGLLVMDDHREVIFNQDLYDLVRVEDLMIEPEDFIYEDDTAAVALEKFKKTGNFNMPVITRDRQYLGFLSRAKFLTQYQDFVEEESDD
ncbi:MAG: chloride channel protein [Bacteroidales bacterium]|nr:chloride channel protein [Bacteroidales bacterium]